MSTENNPLSSALAHLDGLLDEALEQTFPASDAVAIDIERESHDHAARVLDSGVLPTGNRKVARRGAKKHYSVFIQCSDHVILTADCEATR
jgi:hypothetical protein